MHDVTIVLFYLLQELHQLQVVAMYGSEGQQAACKSKTGSSEKALVEQVGAAVLCSGPCTTADMHRWKGTFILLVAWQQAQK